ncbi:MAG: CDP-alcohol phosphatidyltransferase family protein [Pseudomonadota bacterium]
MSFLRAVIPNAITSLGFLLGIWALLAVAAGRFEDAAWLILLCVIMDKLDGTAARFLNASSTIGGQLDSLSDLVTFVVSPAVLWAAVLTAPGAPFEAWPAAVIPYGAASVYALGGAFRLARFNVEADDGLFPDHFHGLATTLSGALTMSLYLTLARHLPLDAWAPWIPPVLLGLGILMVCGLLLPKLKRRESRVFNLFTLVNFTATVVVVLLRILPEYLLVLSVLYVGVGFGVSNLGRRTEK